MAQTHFFATRADPLDFWGDLESKKKFYYVQAGRYAAETPIVYQRAIEMPDLGLVKYPNSYDYHDFLVGEVGTKFSMRATSLRRGGVVFDMYQANNSDTIEFFPGGERGDKIVVVGNFGICADSVLSSALLHLWRRVAQKNGAGSNLTL